MPCCSGTVGEGIGKSIMISLKQKRRMVIDDYGKEAHSCEGKINAQLAGLPRS
jgi:hypothetical protein